MYGEYQEEARIPPPEILEPSPIPREVPRQVTSARKINQIKFHSQEVQGISYAVFYYYYI